MLFKTETEQVAHVYIGLGGWSYLYYEAKISPSATGVAGYTKDVCCSSLKQG